MERRSLQWLDHPAAEEDACREQTRSRRASPEARGLGMDVQDPRPGTNDSSGGSSGRLRRYLKAAIAVLAAFGILGAVGSRVVDAIFSHAEDIGPPLRISVREDPHGGSDGFEAATRSAAGLDARLGKARTCDSLFQAAKRAGAVDVGRSIDDLVLEGRSHRDVTITDMRARILRREPVLAGARISCQSAGAIDAIGIGFNFDEPTPVARTIKDFESRRLGRPYFERGKVVSLKRTEIQPFEVVSFASRDYIEWELEADAVIDGHERRITIRNHGGPFRISGGPQPGEPGPRYARYYEWRWYERPPTLYMSNEPAA